EARTDACRARIRRRRKSSDRPRGYSGEVGVARGVALCSGAVYTKSPTNLHDSFKHRSPSVRMIGAHPTRDNDHLGVGGWAITTILSPTPCPLSDGGLHGPSTS